MNRCLENGDRRDLVGSSLRIALAAGIVAGLALWGYAAGPDSPWFATTAGFTLLGLLDLARYFVRLSPPLGGVRHWERRSALYRFLGVRDFGRLLRRPPLRFLNRHVYRVASHDGKRLLCELEGAEAAHTIAFVLVGVYLGLAVLEGWWRVFAGLAILNLAGNLYPILHLRLSRARMAALPARGVHAVAKKAEPRAI
jgi:hypothetical protein